MGATSRAGADSFPKVLKRSQQVLWVDVTKAKGTNSWGIDNPTVGEFDCANRGGGVAATPGDIVYYANGSISGRGNCIYQSGFTYTRVTNQYSNLPSK